MIHANEVIYVQHTGDLDPRVAADTLPRTVGPRTICLERRQLHFSIISPVLRIREASRPSCIAFRCGRAYMPSSIAPYVALKGNLHGRVSLRRCSPSRERTPRAGQAGGTVCRVPRRSNDAEANSQTAGQPWLCPSEPSLLRLHTRVLICPGSSRPVSQSAQVPSPAPTPPVLNASLPRRIRCYLQYSLK
jgi:hypothetical protein